jgi:hypothetical protein
MPGAHLEKQAFTEMPVLISFEQKKDSQPVIGWLSAC